MTNLVDIPAVVRVLIDYFSAHNEQAGEQSLEEVTVNDKLSLSVLKSELQAQAELSWILKRFRINPFDMENVFDLEDGLRKALERHPVFTGEAIGDEIPVSPDSKGIATPVDPAVIERDTLLEQGSDSLKTFVRYARWANYVFYQACAELPEHELIRERPMLFGTILNLLNHVYTMEWVWKAHLEGKEHAITSRRPTTEISFSDLRLSQVEFDNWLVAYADALAPEQYGEIVNFEFIDGGSGAMSRSDILHHVVNHASYHRGHIEGVFYLLGIEPPTTDLPVFLSA